MPPLIIRSALAKTILKVTYGISVEDMNDPLVVNAEEVVASAAAAGNPGSFLVDTIPISVLIFMQSFSVLLNADLVYQ
jgi:hypothetical protein